ncbi:MAG TPA: choice-of-anchor D domain-containing protein, partial [Thioalkalivibrio sp.]|nr:choice-of-anchor D domain-containing protein [Thioalkalivibrio sp.]
GEVAFTGAGGATCSLAGEGVAPAISVTPASHDFGETALGATATATFTVENTGTATLAGEASTEAPFSIASGASYSIEPGAQQAVIVQFAPAALGTVTGEVAFTGAGGAPCSLTGEGVAPAISVTPASHDFAETAVGSTAQATFTVENTGSGTLIGEASAAAPFSVVEGASYSLGPGAQHQVIVQFQPAALGEATGEVQFTGGDGATCALTGQGIEGGAPAVSVTPTAYDFGTVTVGETGEATFTLTNSGTATLTGEVTVTGIFAIVSGGTYTLEPNAQQGVVVSFTPTEETLYSGILQFSGGDGGRATLAGAGKEPGGIQCFGGAAMPSGGTTRGLPAGDLALVAAVGMLFAGLGKKTRPLASRTIP